MPWVKTNVEDEDIDDAIEQVKDELDCNKSDAAYYLIKQGVGVCRESGMVEQ